METKIAVVTHRPCRICNDELYLPVMAGSFNMSEDETAGYVRDDTGDNISDKNMQYCELTGLYWMWKNSYADNIGLCHYRRYFEGKHGVNLPHILRILRRDKKAFSDVIRIDEASELMRHYQVLLPRPRRYFIESNYMQFAHSHGEYALEETRKIIISKYSEYTESYDRIMAKTTGHRFNMFIMNRDVLDRYCTWLFDILFELEKRIVMETKGKKPDDRRLYGYVAERLLDVWLDKAECRYTEIPYVFIGKEHIVYKAVAMAIRKIKATSWTGLK